MAFVDTLPQLIWRKVLITLALILVLMPLALASLVEVNLQVSTCLNNDQLEQFFDDSKWSILRSRPNKHHFVGRLDALAS